MNMPNFKIWLFSFVKYEYNMNKTTILLELFSSYKQNCTICVYIMMCILLNFFHKRKII